MPKEPVHQLPPSEEVRMSAGRLPGVAFLMDSWLRYRRYRLENNLVSVFEQLDQARREDGVKSRPAARMRSIGKIAI